MILSGQTGVHDDTEKGSPAWGGVGMLGDQEAQRTIGYVWSLNREARLRQEHTLWAEMNRGCCELVLALTAWHPCSALAEVTSCSSTRCNFQGGIQTGAETALPGSPHEQNLNLSLIYTLPTMPMLDEDAAVPFLERGCFWIGSLLERGIGAGSDFLKLWARQREDDEINSS